MEEADRSPGQTVLGPDNQQLTLSRGMLNHLEGGGQATLIRGRKPVQVHSFIIDLIHLFHLIHLYKRCRGSSVEAADSTDHLH